MTKKLAKTFSRFHFPRITTPFAFLALLLLTFGVYLPSWGFYWDDWPSVFIIHSGGSFWQYYQSDRPLSAWIDILFGNLLGTNPLAWHVAYLLIWWGVVVAFWWCLRLIWPKAERQSFLAAALFSIYPVFFSQAIAVTYIRATLNYALFILSLCFMVVAARRPKQSHLFTVLSLVTGTVQLFSIEYYWGLEFLRPALLWLVIGETAPAWKARLKKTFLRWLPYLVILLLALVWRFAIFGPTHEANSPTMLLGLLHSPLATIKSLVKAVWDDLSLVLIGRWAETVTPEALENSRVSLASWGLALLVGVGIGIYAWRMEAAAEEAVAAKPSWSRQAICIGALGVVIGMVPGWITAHQVGVGMYADRFALPAMVGASLLFTGLIYELVTRHLYRIILLAVLVGLASGLYFRSGNSYRKDWTAQKDFFWQLYWRAPAIEPNTALLTEGGIFKYVTQYSLSSGIDSLYPVSQGTTQLPYWSFELDNLDEEGITAAQLEQGVQLTHQLRTFSFSASSLDSLVISYQLDAPHCLWVVSKLDANNPYLQTYTDQTLSVTNLERILPEPSDQTYPDPSIFGAEPQHTWCYYFEKADLARQYQDWETVTSLGDQAIALDYGPSNPYEWTPFIEGYIHEKDWEQAVSLTQIAYESESQLQPALCRVWSRALHGVTLTPEESSTVNQALDPLGCSD